MKSLKSMFVQAVLGSITLAKFREELKGREPWKAEKAEKARIDAAMVRAVAAQYGLIVTDKGRKFPSGLTVGLPDEPTTQQVEDHNACTTQLCRYRKLLVKPKAPTVLNHGDKVDKLIDTADRECTTQRARQAFVNKLIRKWGLS